MRKCTPAHYPAKCTGMEEDIASAMWLSVDLVWIATSVCATH